MYKSRLDIVCPVVFIKISNYLENKKQLMPKALTKKDRTIVLPFSY